MENYHQNRDQKVAMMLKYFGIIMAIFYFMMGLALIFLPLFTVIDSYLRYTFAGMLIVYGAFRIYRILKK